MGEVNIDENIIGVIPSPYDSRDYSINNLVKITETTLPSSYRITIRPPVFSQGSTGSCVACALASCRYIQEVMQEGESEKFSVKYIYGNRRDADSQDEGMIPRQALKTLVDFGDCHWAALSGYSDYPSAKLLYEARKEELDDLAYPYKINSYYKLDTVEDIKTAVYNIGCAIVVYRTTNPLRYPTNGYVTYDADSEGGLHCMTIVGWTGDDHWIVLNSWGTDYGIDGYCYIPFDYPIQESWTMVDDLRYEELVLKRNFEKVRGIFLGIRRESKKRYVT